MFWMIHALVNGLVFGHIVAGYVIYADYPANFKWSVALIAVVCFVLALARPLID